MLAFTVAPPLKGGDPTAWPCRAGIDVVRGGADRPWEVVVGEPGRGRREVRVPLPAGAVVEEDGRHPSRGVLVSVPGGGGALVRVPDLSGYRGGWSAGSTDPTPPTPEAAAPPWRVIAEGECAEGDAGAMGGGADVLVVVRDGDAVLLRRHGRLYGAPARLRLAVTGGVATLRDEAAYEASREAAAAWAEVIPADLSGDVPAAVSCEVRLGAPTRRQMEAGYWEAPVAVRDASGRELGRVVPTSDGWSRPAVDGPVVIERVEHEAGHHGGWYTIRLLVPEGATARHEPPLPYEGADGGPGGGGLKHRPFGGLGGR